MIILVEQNGLGFETFQLAGDFHAAKAATDNDDAGFSQVSNTRLRVY